MDCNLGVVGEVRWEMISLADTEFRRVRRGVEDERQAKMKTKMKRETYGYGIYVHGFCNLHYGILHLSWACFYELTDRRMDRQTTRAHKYF